MQVCEDILDIVESYYKVSRKRFVDAVCQQVVNHFLLDGPKSPLKVLCADRILKLSPELLEMIAGEEPTSKTKRQVLMRELTKAVEVLRT
jgi:hypothetical protein